MTVTRYLLFAVIILAMTDVRADTPWEEYLDNPTSLNAARVMVLTYTSSTDQLSSDDLQILQNQVLARDAQSFRLAVRLYQVADGANAEGLGVLLGRAARSQPEFFLSELAALAIPCSELSWPLNSPGLEYVDRTEAQRYEIRKRREALSSVATRKLRRVRAECLNAFR